MESLILLLLGPVFLVFIGVEAWYWHRRGIAQYSFIDTLCNGVLALTHQGVDMLAWLLILPLFYSIYQHRLFTIELNAGGIFLLFIAQDFFYYWFHRCSHRIRWMWAAHVVHHSSQRLNLSTAFRQSLTYPIAGMWAFWLPLAWLGFAPKAIVACVALSLAYQFFVHTEAVGKLGLLEKILNTPSHHRVHHAKNPGYIDRNYAGVLIIWDKMFGTYVEETQQCEYGIVRQIDSHHPLVLIFHEWRDMGRDFLRPGPLMQRLKHFWAPPEWQRETGNSS